MWSLTKNTVNGAEIEDIDDMREYLVWEAQGMRPNYSIEDCPE